MNKFRKLITNTNSALQRRAELVNQTATIAMQNFVNELTTRKAELEAKLMDLTDLAPGSTTSLRPGTKDWDAGQWVREIQSLKEEIYTVDLKLSLANETYTEFFVDTEEA
jgi:hypothetical protein